ncbi:DUF4190 domain-containing protein [Streptomyces edwardsiae]|uniref:DUF4190 domain-containing protein n=1 Tax=Streptomyces edwardsiae TaxID=3075527 RepID=A0ABU2QCT1_9ACTN|nr:DUF4190 domain-containing protein [Streptomyces sp. DSM 41635]MDT0402266.1 DUF4190 domain-containing protein [Streptomyces sp. DSM 41635]
MTDATQPGGDTNADDPWAAPDHRTSLDKDHTAGGGRPAQAPATPTVADGLTAPRPPSVHDQPTVIGMPGAGFVPPAGATPPGAPGTALPPPPVGPNGPGAPGGYGYPGYPQGYGWPGMPMQRENGMGIAAMVLGILACCLFCLYGIVSVVLGVLAIVFGVKGRQKAERGLADNHGQAQAGLIMGIIGLVLGIAVIILLAIGITAAINEGEDRGDDEDYYGAHRPVVTAPVLR